MTLDALSPLEWLLLILILAAVAWWLTTGRKK